MHCHLTKFKTPDWLKVTRSAIRLNNPWNGYSSFSEFSLKALLLTMMEACMQAAFINTRKSSSHLLVTLARLMEAGIGQKCPIITCTRNSIVHTILLNSQVGTTPTWLHTSPPAHHSSTQRELTCQTVSFPWKPLHPHGS